MLTKSGATVNECVDGLKAVEYIRQCFNSVGSIGAINVSDRNENEANQTVMPDLILLDMQMRNLDGCPTAQRLRELGFTSPIIAFTADAMQGDMNKCLEAGCNDCLSKPIDKTAMLKKIAELMKYVDQEK